MTPGRRAVALSFLGIALIVVAVVVGLSFSRPANRIETGVVVAVDAVSLTDVRGFTIRTADGRTVVFRVGRLENGAAFPPGHLAEHAATATQVVVTYRTEDGALVAVRIEDGPALSPG